MPESFVLMQLLRICRHSFGVNVEIIHLLLLQSIIQHVSAYTLLLGFFLSRSLSVFQTRIKIVLQQYVLYY
jgi:hypothetical protein